MKKQMMTINEYRPKVIQYLRENWPVYFAILYLIAILAGFIFTGFAIYEISKGGKSLPYFLASFLSFISSFIIDYHVTKELLLKAMLDQYNAILEFVHAVEEDSKNFGILETKYLKLRSECNAEIEKNSKMFEATISECHKTIDKFEERINSLTKENDEFRKELNLSHYNKIKEP